MADLYHRTSTELSVLVPEVWSRRYYDVLLAQLPFNSVISRDYEGDIQSVGDRVKISTFPEFAAATPSTRRKNIREVGCVLDIELPLTHYAPPPPIAEKRPSSALDPPP